jgi:hypothetical protein
MDRFEQIGADCSGHCEDRDSHSRSAGGRLLHGRRLPGAEAVSDGLGQARLIHLPFYTGDYLPFGLGPPAFPFHEAALFITMNGELPYRVRSRPSLRHPANRIEQRVKVFIRRSRLAPPPRISPATAAEKKKHHHNDQDCFHIVTSLEGRSGPALVATVPLLL